MNCLYLQTFAEHSCGEVMCHELVIDEAHDTAAKEQPWKLQAQQNLPHKCFIPIIKHTVIQCHAQTTGIPIFMWTATKLLKLDSKAQDAAL